MDSEKEKDINFKPSNWLYIFLFIYYSVWILQSVGAISHYITFGFDSFLGYDTVEWLCFVLFIIAGIYSLYAVIKTLRGDKDCITSLKWSLILVFLYTMLDPTRGQIPTYSILTWSVIFLIRPVFYLIFYLYLCFAKGIKRRYPKSDRKFGPSGWVWTGLMAAFVSVGIFAGWQQYQISEYCKRVEVAVLNLNPGEVSDGYVLFASQRKWDKWGAQADTLYIDERIETLPTIMSVDSISQIYISSGRCDQPDARTYNQVLVASLGALSANLDGDFGKLKETSFTDTVVSGKRVLSTTYETTTGSIPAYFDVVMVVEVNTPKCCVAIRVDKNPIDRTGAVDFAKDLQFDLQNVAKGKDDKDRNNAKDENPNRTAYRNQQPNPNMFASLFHRFRPRHLFSVMTLKHDEREITDRKRDNVFYNL